MYIEYTPTWLFRPGDLVRLTGPGWRLHRDPTYGDLARVLKVDPGYEEAIVEWVRETGETSELVIDNYEWSALLVERRSSKP